MPSRAKHARTPHTIPPRTAETWRAIARSVRLAELELTPAAEARPCRAAGLRAVAHLTAGRFLLGRLAERHAEGARTRLGYTWRLRSCMRGDYARALDEALAYARGAAHGSAPSTGRPALFRHAGLLPELERFLPDRLLVTAQ